MRMTMPSKHLMIAFFVFLFSIGTMLFTPFYKLFAILLNFYIVKRLRVCLLLYYNSKIILTQEKLSSYHIQELIVYVITVLVSCVYYFLFGFILVNRVYLDSVQENSLVFLITFTIWTGIFYLKKLTKFEISYLSYSNNLHFGYGGAIWYYKNYLDIILTDDFSSRILQFEKKVNVELHPKLYILCPKSCKVLRYIDCIENIEFSKDLNPFKIDRGGIIEREYNISIYRIEYKGEYFRCAVEYAQPFKVLYALKEKRKISASEMDMERKSFIKNLKQMLNDRKNSFKVCELVEYDDDEQTLHEVFWALPSLQAFKRKVKDANEEKN